MKDPNAPRGLKRVWIGVLALVIVLLIVYTIRRVTSDPVELRTDSIPAATE
ncbi:MAG: hypothetical protein ACREMZ_06575 [Gemmatimonadales bacterium]